MSRVKSIIILAASFSVAGMAILAHHEILGYWFTGVDTLALIETSRFTTVDGALALFTQPLMSGSGFVQKALFYRPIASFSYGLDYLIWGLTPFGYHLTDLLLHAIASVLVWALVYTAADGRPITATLSGVIFAIHPLTAEVVPTPARRQDILVTVFVVLSLLLLSKRSTAVENQRRYTVGALFAYSLALGSKETAIVLLPLAIIWWPMVSRKKSANTLTPSGWMRIAATYVVVTIAYLSLRFLVLGGIGSTGQVSIGIKGVTAIIARYVTSLIYPIDLSDATLATDLQVVPNGLYVVLLCVVIISIVTIIQAGGLRRLLTSQTGQLLAFFTTWIVLPIPLFVWIGRYTLRSGYLSLVPVAAILSILLTTIVRKATNHPVSVRETAAHVLNFVIVATMVLSLITWSPLVQTYDGWEDAGTVSRKTLETVYDATEEMPRNTTISVGPVVHPRSTRYMTAAPRAKSVTYVWGNTIEAWLRLQESDNSIRVEINRTTTLCDVPSKATAVVATTDISNQMTVRIRYESANDLYDTSLRSCK